MLAARDGHVVADPATTVCLQNTTSRSFLTELIFTTTSNAKPDQNAKPHYYANVKTTFIHKLSTNSNTMNDQSPPKRVTRARAAAKTDNLKIATAASKASKVTRKLSVRKQKAEPEETHEDEDHDEPDQIIEPEPKPTRGRPKKAAQPVQVEPEMDAPAKVARGRPKKIVDIPAPPPVRATRGRAKKEEESENEGITVEDPPKRTTRTRTATVSKATAPKKSVKFEEPDKENIVPIGAKDDAKPAGTGLRARPVRKPAVPTAARATRGRAKTLTDETANKPAPLSPKKATQVGSTKEVVSEDELAANEKTPMKPLMKSPVKPPGSIFGTAKKLDFSNSVTVYNANDIIARDLKGSVMASPARRPPESPFKETMKTSPQRLAFGGSILQSPFKPSLPAPRPTTTNTLFKTSLLQSPARRPQSPMKITENGSPSRPNHHESVFAGTPKASTFKISRFTTPRTLTKSVTRPGQMLPPPAPANVSTGSPNVADDKISIMAVEPSLKFSGRLSSIMPRDVDPAFNVSEPVIVEPAVTQTTQVEPIYDAMVLDQQDTLITEDPMDAESTTPAASPSRNSTGSFTLRDVDESPFHDSESEDELAADGPDYSPVPLHGFKISSPNFTSSPATPTPFAAIAKTPKTAATIRSERIEKIGFTPLARQLSDWMAASPEKSEGSNTDSETTPTGPAAHMVESVIEPSPVKSTFFEDEMSIRDEIESAPELLSAEVDLLEEPEAVELDEEDLALAQEADEMSLLAPDEVDHPAPETMFSVTEPEIPTETETEIEPALSEASQEYGDENAMPIDPELLALATPESVHKYATPKRVLAERVFHTVSKVPLKPAADETPMRPSPVKRSASISKMPVQRPTTLARSNTVISYSQSNSTPRSQRKRPVINNDVEPFVTPSKPTGPAWSTMGTPARTPRRDLNTALLKGAVVFVDVHTTEGADASVLFTELLTQMGARCVKSWNWSPSEENSKIGITHVIFKDGGKRTLEKTKETGGVVQCVGVGWVLE